MFLCRQTVAALLDAGVRQERQLLQPGQINNRLDRAADVDKSEAHRLHIAAKHLRGIVVLKREQCYRWQVVKHNDTEERQHHLEGLLLHGVHLVFPCTAGLLQGPQDAHIAQHHPTKCYQDLNGEYLLEVGKASHSFGCRVCKGEAQHQHREA